MELWISIIAIVIALYGAIISTILGINEIKKGKRGVKVFLDYLLWENSAQLRIVNNQYRPVTITQIAAIFPERGELVPANAMDNGSLPRTIKDGEQIIIPLNAVGETLFKNEDICGLVIYDNEGKVYTKIEETFFDSKHGIYQGEFPNWKKKVNVKPRKKNFFRRY